MGNAQPAKIAEAAEKATPITQSRFGLAVEKFNTWSVTCDMETTVNQILEESYWANISMFLKPGDLIVVMPDNMAWRLDLHVAGAGPQYAHVVNIGYHNLVPATARVKLPSLYKVEYAGLTHKWRFLREGKMMRDGFETEGQARRAAANHEEAVRR